MTPFHRAQRAAAALSRHLLGRCTDLATLSDAFLAEAIGASNAVRGRSETATTLRALAAYLEATDVD